MIFYDFEVFIYDWVMVALDMEKRSEIVITNDREKLCKFFEENKREVWAGFNSRHYDQWILKCILCDLNPKECSDYIVIYGRPGWSFAQSLFRQIKINNYDVMANGDRGLKTFEGFLGLNIKETSVPFDVDRKLTDKELQETVKYCQYDVEQTINVFLEKEKESEPFLAHMNLTKMAGGLNNISKTAPQLAAQILGAVRQDYNDEFNFDLPTTLKVEKYKEVVDWYSDLKNRRYYGADGKKNQLSIDIAGVPHVFGYGGIHGAIPQYTGEGLYINIDVLSQYPTLMINYGLLSRSVKSPEKYEELYDLRLERKKENNPLHKALKLALNSTYGAMKDPNNPLYDPLQANRVCIYGQLLILDLMEKLEEHAEIIQSNTDGILIKHPGGGNPDAWYSLIDDICYDWERRTGLTVEFLEYAKVFQKDVNNYILIDSKGGYKSIGAYLKKLTPLDYDLAIVNKALINFMVNDIPLGYTIDENNKLIDYQLVTKISNKYTHIIHGDEILKEKTIRVFASKRSKDLGVKKIHAKTGKPAKMANSPEQCFIDNGAVWHKKVPPYLDKNWYLNLARRRLNDFGIIEFDQINFSQGRKVII